jgi:hypothetical protein
MKNVISPLLRFLAVGSLLLAFASPASAALQAPKSVATALRVLNQVVGHTGRLIASKDYDKVAGEHPEVVEGAEMLREALRGEPADFTAKVNAAVDDAVKSSEAMGKIAAAGDAAKAEAAHDDFAAKVKAVIDLFPEDVHPKARRR